MINLQFKLKKTTQAIHYFANKAGGEIEKLKVLKLLFFTDRYMMRKYATALTGDQYFAMKNGPVASKAYDLIKLNADHLGTYEFEYAVDHLIPIDNGVRAKENGNHKSFSKLEVASLDLIWDEYGHMTSKELVGLTHEFPEWKLQELKLDNSKREPIDICDFFLPSPQGFIDLADFDTNELEESFRILEADALKDKQLASLFKIVS